MSLEGDIQKKLAAQHQEEETANATAYENRERSLQQSTIQMLAEQAQQQYLERRAAQLEKKLGDIARNEMQEVQRTLWNGKGRIISRHDIVDGEPHAYLTLEHSYPDAEKVVTQEEESQYDGYGVGGVTVQEKSHYEVSRGIISIEIMVGQEKDSINEDGAYWRASGKKLSPVKGIDVKRFSGLESNESGDYRYSLFIAKSGYFSNFLSQTRHVCAPMQILTPKIPTGTIEISGIHNAFVDYGVEVQKGLAPTANSAEEEGSKNINTKVNFFKRFLRR
jgi:hypothetical protein